MRIVKVSQNQAGQRLDKLLGKYLNLAGKGFIYKMIRKKNITLNGKKCTGAEKLEEGDEIRLFLSDETIESFSETRVQAVKKVSLDVVYEDSHMILINKPAGMLSQKAEERDESLVEYLIRYLMDRGELTREELQTFRPSVCNRLDRNTTGLVAAGKSLAGLQILSAAFKDRSLHKTYLCLAAGRMTEEKTISGFLTKDEKTNQVTVCKTQTPGSLPIVTGYRPVAAGERCTLLAVDLITGRTHQIRAHLASIGHPILGDYKYGDSEVNRRAKERYQISAQMLHSWKLQMPETLPEPMGYLAGRIFTAPLPNAFRIVLKGEGLERGDGAWEPGIRED